MYFHAIAIQPGNRRKSIPNKTDEQMFENIVLPFVRTGTIKAKWGSTVQSYQVIELRVYKTEKAWDKRSGIALDDFLKSKKNLYDSFENRARSALETGSFRVFVVMPIQGDKFGTQDDQRIHKEFDDRFEAVESALHQFNCVSIRIDQEYPLEELVARIKKEIADANFVVADLTDERPSCYFEAGYAEALNKNVVYVASKESVIQPKVKTKIHFDVHMNVLFFSNHKELKDKIVAAVKKNRDKLLPDSD